MDPRADARFDAPWLAPYRPLIDALGPPDVGVPGAWLDAANALADARGCRLGEAMPLRFEAAGGMPAADYERVAARTGRVPTRVEGEGAWHDWFNALVWLALPRTKAALNLRHVQAIAQATGPARGPMRDRLTLLDENGACLIGDDPEPAAALRAHDWTGLFVRGRSAFQRGTRVLLFGHGLMQRLMRPYKAACAHALVLDDDTVHAGGEPTPDADWMARADGRLAARIRTLTLAERPLPLPVLGVPGWWPANASPGFYDDAAVFRPAGRTLRGACPSS